MEAENNIKSDNYIQLKKNEDILILKIRDDKGNETGESLKFNLEDIELPLIYQDILEQDKKNRQDLRNQLLIIDKKQDHKGKKLLSANQEARIRATNEFFKKEENIYNMFLGENGVRKLLNGEKFTWETLDMIDEIIEKQIMPKLNITTERINERIMKKYNTQKRSDVIE